MAVGMNIGSWQDIQHFLQQADETDFKKRQNRVADEIRASQTLNIDNPDEVARLLLTEEGYVITTHSVKGESSEGASDAHKINTNNEYVDLADCRYLNICIPETEEHRRYAALYYNDNGKKQLHPEKQRYYMDENMNKMLFQKLQDEFMSRLNEKLQCEPLDRELLIVTTREELEEGITRFVKTHHNDYKKLFISFVGHGGEDGSIATHDRNSSIRFTNNDFHQHVNQLSKEYKSIPIRVLMGNCYSHIYDEGKLSINITVHATTNTKRVSAVCTFSRKSSGHIIIDDYKCKKVVGIDKVEHHQLNEFVRLYITPPPNNVAAYAEHKGAPSEDVDSIKFQNLHIDA